MEYLIFAALVAFGWFQTERLEDAKDDADRWQSVAQSNYEEWQEAIEANGDLKDSLDNLESSYQQCTNDLQSVVIEINTWKEANQKQAKEIDRLKGDLETLDYSNDCRLPINLDIEAYRSTGSGN